MHPRVIQSLGRQYSVPIDRALLARVNEQCRIHNEAIANATNETWVDLRVHMDLTRLVEKLAKQRGGWVTRVCKSGVLTDVQYYFPNGSGDFEVIAKGFGCK